MGELIDLATQREKRREKMEAALGEGWEDEVVGAATCRTCGFSFGYVLPRRVPEKWVPCPSCGARDCRMVLVDE